MRQEDIFIQYTPSHKFQEQNGFLDLHEFALEDDLFSEDFLSTPNFLPRLVSMDQDLLFPVMTPEEFHRGNSSTEEVSAVPVTESVESSTVRQAPAARKQKTAKSHKTKNICFNICQKTIKVLKSRLYSDKLREFCSELDLGVESETVVAEMLRQKKTLTGPKALQHFIEQEEPVNQIFKEFMKWFLKEKYLRHAISEGTMDDLKGYLEFKNNVIMGILEN